MIRKLFVLTVIALVGLNCSKFSVRTDIEKSYKVSTFKKSGLILRISAKSRLLFQEQERNTDRWIAGHKPIKNILLLSGISDKVKYFNQDIERFYQESLNRNFLKYKSLGVINLYLRNNESELKKTITENDLSGLVIYEVYSVLSTAMQFMDFDSVIIITDRNLNVLYMDHQSDGFNIDDIGEIDPDKIKDELLNYISERLIEKLIDLEFIAEKD